jgi:hypothetical protein
MKVEINGLIGLRSLSQILKAKNPSEKAEKSQIRLKLVSFLSTRRVKSSE